MARKDAWLKILKAGAGTVRRKGFNNTGIQEVLASAGVPRGSFYYYFRSKEDFGLQLIDYFAGYVGGRLERCLSDRSLEPLDRIELFLDEFAGSFESEGFLDGCPIGNLAQELGGIGDAYHARLESVLRSMAKSVEGCLEEAVRAGHASSRLEPAETAEFIINSWEGAVMRSKVSRSPAPLAVFKSMLFGLILKRP